MDTRRILREAQKIASKFSFWMVSGNIAHLYGYVCEISEKKYELEIIFDDKFPNSPPQFIYYDNIKKLLGEFQLNKLKSWALESDVVEILHELREKIEKTIQGPKRIIDKQLASMSDVIGNNIQSQEIQDQSSKGNIRVQVEEDYITPDLNAYPPNLQSDEYITPSNHGKDSFYNDQTSRIISRINSPEKTKSFKLDPNFTKSEQKSVALNTELGLIQQEYAFDQKGQKRSDIKVYITITLRKTFVIQVDFTNYPERPNIVFFEEVRKILGDPYQSLDLLRNWDIKKPFHVVEILHELENKLNFLKKIELESKKIIAEYQCELEANSATQIKVYLFSYGFKKYMIDVDLSPYPKPPVLKISSDLQKLIRFSIGDLKAIRNWKGEGSEPIEIIREISWLVDKNSRINFEIELLKEHYEEIQYDSSTETLNIDMKGKMKTQDITFKFQIILPIDYPIKMPDVKVLNKFELETHEKIRKDLQASLNDFFTKWTPFSYLVDLFNLISNKIFEVSVVSCVICHKIECPTCAVRIAEPNGNKSCYISCPHCERSYHKHCWDQTIKSFGKCGFCLKTPI